MTIDLSTLCVDDEEHERATRKQIWIDRQLTHLATNDQDIYLGGPTDLPPAHLASLITDRSNTRVFQFENLPTTTATTTFRGSTSPSTLALKAHSSEPCPSLDNRNDPCRPNRPAVDGPVYHSPRSTRMIIIRDPRSCHIADVRA